MNGGNTVKRKRWQAKYVRKPFLVSENILHHPKAVWPLCNVRYGSLRVWGAASLDLVFFFLKFIDV